LTVPILLGSLFISQYVKALLPPERIIVLWNGVDEDSAVTMSLAEDVGKALKKSYMVRSTQDFVVPAMTEMVITAFVKGLEGLSMICPRMDGGRRLIYAKNGVFELPGSEEPFSIIVANFSQKGRTVERGQVIGVANPLNDSQVCLMPSEQKRMNAVIVDAIAHYISKQEEWDEYLATKPLSKDEYRHEFLRRIERFSRAARETMQERTARHKEVLDRHVRKRADIDIGDSVFVRTYVTEPARSPKL
jgi:hypothetical protein